MVASKVIPAGRRERWPFGIEGCGDGAGGCRREQAAAAPLAQRRRGNRGSCRGWEERGWLGWGAGDGAPAEHAIAGGGRGGAG